MQNEHNLFFFGTRHSDKGARGFTLMGTIPQKNPLFPNNFVIGSTS